MTDEARQAEVMLDVLAERKRQDHIWGVQDNLAPIWLSRLMREVGEAANALNGCWFSGRDLVEYRQQLVKVAAVAVSAVEDYDRKLAGDSE